MRAIELLIAALPYLRTLLNLHTCGVAPCMSSKDTKTLVCLIDEIWELTAEESRSKLKGN
jgi:hypothetical protein